MNALAKIIVWLLMEVHCAVGLIFQKSIVPYYPHKIPKSSPSFPTQMYVFFIIIFRFTSTMNSNICSYFAPMKFVFKML